jgi:hypothetical protein
MKKERRKIMMGKSCALVGFLLLGAVPAFAQEDCVDPIAPAAIDGGTATKAQMEAARGDVMNFIKSSDDFQDCLDASYNEQKQKAFKDKKPLDPQIGQQIDAEITANQRMKEKIGAEFNAAVAAYKAKHPNG